MKRTLTATSVALCAVVLLSACGSSSSSSSSTAASASGSSRRTALAACLKQHGVSFPARRGGPYGGPPGAGPGAGAPGGAPPPGGAPSQRRPPAGGFFFGGGPRSTKFRAALKACGANFPAGQRRRPRFTKTTLTKFVACVRQHGYNLPTPNTSGTGPVFPSGIQTKPKFITASRACASLLRPPSGSGSTTTG